jgi:hypothetical protein
VRQELGTYKALDSFGARMALMFFCIGDVFFLHPSVSSAVQGIEPPTRGFSARCRVFQGFKNQSLAASCRPLPRHTKAQSWHTQSELVTFLAQARLETEFVVLLLELWHEHKTYLYESLPARS